MSKQLFVGMRIRVRDLWARGGVCIQMNFYTAQSHMASCGNIFINTMLIYSYDEESIESKYKRKENI